MHWLCPHGHLLRRGLLWFAVCGLLWCGLQWFVVFCRGWSVAAGCWLCSNVAEQDNGQCSWTSLGYLFATLYC